MKNKKKFLIPSLTISSLVALPTIFMSQSNWTPETTKKDVEYTNYQIPNIVSDKYIITPKEDVLFVYNLDGDLLYSLDAEFLSSGKQDGKITKIFLDGENLYTISSFSDGLGYTFLSYLTVFNLDKGKICFSKSLFVGNNAIDNIFEISENELMFTYSLSKTKDIFKNKNHWIINRKTFELSQKIFSDNDLFPDGILLDVFKVNDSNTSKLMVLSTQKANDVTFTKFAYDGNFSSPEYPLDSWNKHQTIGLSSTIVKNNITNLTNLNYGYKKEFFNKDNKNYVILDFNNNYKKADEEVKRDISSRKFVIIDINQNFLNYSGAVNMPKDPNVSQEMWNQSLSGLASLGRISQPENFPQKAITWPANIQNILGPENIFVNPSYTVIDDKIFTTLNSYERDLKPLISKKIFKIDFTPNKHLTASELSYANNNNNNSEFNFGTIHKIPGKDIILKINNKYDGIFAFKWDKNNSTLTPMGNIVKKTSPISFNPINEDITQTFVSDFNPNIESLYTASENIEITNKEIIKDLEKGNFLLKLTVSKTPWYSDVKETFVVTKLYTDFDALNNYELEFENNDSNKLTNFKLKNENFAFKKQLASQVTKKQILDNNIIKLSEKLKSLISEENLILEPNDETKTLKITIKIDNLNQKIKDYLTNSNKVLSYQYTNFDNISKEFFYWNQDKIKEIVDTYNNANEVDQSKINNYLFNYQGYQNNPTVEPIIDAEKNILNVKVSLKHLNNDENTTIFEYEFNFSKDNSTTNNDSSSQEDNNSSKNESSDNSSPKNETANQKLDSSNSKTKIALGVTGGVVSAIGLIFGTILLILKKRKKKIQK